MIQNLKGLSAIMAGSSFSLRVFLTDKKSGTESGTTGTISGTAGTKSGAGLGS